MLPQVKQVLHSKVSRSFTEYRAIAGKSFIDPKDLTKVSLAGRIYRPQCPRQPVSIDTMPSESPSMLCSGLRPAMTSE
jgi:hypothetical protein